jgi:hypothetical protein
MSWARVSGWVVLVAGAALAAGGCATEREQQMQAQESVPRPEWRIGDRWAFQRTVLAGQTAVVTHQVVAATVDGYTMRIVGLGPEVTRQWTSDLHLVQEGTVDGRTARYDPPASYFAWPIGPAKTWSQTFRYADGRYDGQYANTWKVGPAVEAIDTVAGRFYALRVERWSGAQRLEVYWYNARVRYWVRLEDYLRGYVEELVEFRRWGS